MEAEGDSTSAESGLDFEDTELKLALPGDRKRDLRSRIRSVADSIDPPDRADDDGSVGSSESQVSGCSSHPISKNQAVGWPPLGPSRKNVMKNYRYVKVAVDGTPYLRKVNLENYNSYQELLKALEDMFSCFTIQKFQDESKLVDLVNGVEYVPTYEDREGDWMLVGDVPWKMFVEICKRLRLMKRSDVSNQAKS